MKRKFLEAETKKSSSKSSSEVLRKATMQKVKEAEGQSHSLDVK